jgi:hypothetical protein
VRERTDLRQKQRERQRSESGNSAGGSGQGVFVLFSAGAAYAGPPPDSSQNGHSCDGWSCRNGQRPCVLRICPLHTRGIPS